MRLLMVCLVLGFVLIWAAVMCLAVFMITVHATAWPLLGTLFGLAVVELYWLAHNVPTLRGPSGSRRD